MNTYNIFDRLTPFVNKRTIFWAIQRIYQDARHIYQICSYWNVEVIIMIGIAGAGKTTSATKLFPKHVRISLDEIPQSDRNIEYDLIEKHLKVQHSIVIDDTNLTKDIRSKHIMLAKKYNADIKAFFVDLPMWKIQMNNKNRDKIVPEAALLRMQKQLDIPQEDGGFHYIQTTTSNFVV